MQLGVLYILYITLESCPLAILNGTLGMSILTTDCPVIIIDVLKTSDEFVAENEMSNRMKSF